MTTTSPVDSDPRMTAAIAEMKDLIRQSYPDTTFLIDVRQNQEPVFVTAVVNVDDPDEVVDCFIDRLLTIQLEEGLPLHIIPVRNPARLEQMIGELQSGQTFGAVPRTAAG